MNALKEEYQHRYETALKPLAIAIQDQLAELFKNEARIDRISTRAKSVDRFLAKAKKLECGKPKYSEPLHQIQDQIGARIVTFYRSDVEKVAEIINKYFRSIEEQNLVPESEWEFGYFGHHNVVIIPSDAFDPSMDRNLTPEFFEIQVKTLFQHAWSEANHDLGYKPGQTPLDPDAKRRLAYTSAQAWGADRIFDELFLERSQNGS